MIEISTYTETDIHIWVLTLLIEVPKNRLILILFPVDCLTRSVKHLFSPFVHATRRASMTLSIALSAS